LKKTLALFLCLAGSAHAQENPIYFDGYDKPGACPAGRIESTMVSWRYDGIGRRVIDATQAENIWGRAYAGGPTIGFPWMNVFAIFWSFPRNGYIAARFEVPMDTPSWAWGMFTHGETIPGPATDMAISPRCGDFNPPGQFCQARGTRIGQRMGTWGMPGFPGVSCKLQPGQAYYLNIRLSDPTVEDYFCNTGACQTTVQHNHTH
jgi:hypothetical protein